MDSSNEMDDPVRSLTGRGSKTPQFIAAFIAWFAPLSMGMAIGYSSPALPELEEPKPNGLDLDDSQKSWFASLLPVGALIGGPVCAFFIDKCGRKYGVMMSGLPFVAGWLLIMLAENVGVLYLGRFLTGFACGMASLAAPTYIAETTSKELRGLLGGGFQLAVVVGVLLVFACGILLKYVWLAAEAAIFATLMVLLMLIVPETPRWYFDHRNREQGVRSLRWLRGSGGGGGSGVAEMDVEQESQEIERSILQQGDSVRLTDMLRFPNLYKPLIISVMLMFFQQFSGINAVIFFSNDIFKDASFGTKEKEEIASVVLAVIQVLFTLVGCVLMDKAGRRMLLIVAGSIMTISCVSFGTYYVLTCRHIVNKDSVAMMIMSVSSLCAYISGFSIGWGPIPWLIMSEIFPAKARGRSSGIATACNWTFAFIVTRFFQPLQLAITTYGTFFAFAGINFLGVAFVFFFVPETKGKSLEEIERHFIPDTHNDDYVRLDEDD